MDDFERELRSGFLEEATQLLQETEQCFLALETKPNDSATLEKIFRNAHNIKGSSKAVGFDELGAFTHEFESFLLKCKNGQLAITPATVSLMLAANDHVNQLVEALKVDDSAKLDGSAIVAQMLNFDPHAVVAGVADVAPDTVEAAEAAPEFFPEEAVPAIDEDIFVVPEASAFPEEPEVLAMPFEVPQAPPVEVAMTPEPAVVEEVPAVVVAMVEPPKAVPAVASTPAVAKSSGDETLRVSVARLERLLNSVGEMVILQTVLKEQVAADNPDFLRRTVQQMGKITKEVQDLSMSLRMVPLKQTFQKMQRIVRDTSGLLGKDVHLVVEGEETEVDKNVLESLSDPLVHMIRNAVDHGIESHEKRAASGKPRAGRVWLRAYHQSGKLVIEVKDDGGGISPSAIRAKAIEKGILKPDAIINDQTAVELVFHPGFSTKAQVTEVSGRGVGMDVVKTNIEALQGEVLIETQYGTGSTFKIVLPLTLAIIDGMVIRCETERFVIPRAHVHESVQLRSDDLRFNTGMGLVLLLRGENLPAVQLGQVLGRGKTSAAREVTAKIAIIVRSQGRPFAVLVDDIIGQHQVVIKKLGSELQHLRGFSGSAILGDGRPALILELGDLLNASPQRTSDRKSEDRPENRPEIRPGQRSERGQVAS